MRLTGPVGELQLDEDVYAIRARGAGAELLFNAGYDRIGALDLATGRRLPDIRFPAAFGDFAVEHWFPAAGGNHCFVTARDEAGVMLRLDFGTRSADPVGLPTGMGVPTGLCWFAPEIHLLDEDGAVWVLRENRLERAASDALPDPFARMLRLNEPGRRLGVLRVSHQQGGLYLMNETEIGFRFFDLRRDHLVAYPPRTVGVAYAAGHLVLQDEAEAVAIGAGGRRRIGIAPAGTTLLGIESLRTGGAEYLASVAMEEGRRGSILSWFRVE